jgi:cytochrome c
VPGTAMGYAGVPDGEERADLIAYLERATRSPECGS